jgi:hypothetical protein
MMVYGLVVRVPGYISRVPGSIAGSTIFAEKEGLERDPLSLLSAIWGATWKKK